MNFKIFLLQAILINSLGQQVHGFDSLKSLTGENVPKTVKELWADYDPRKEALETEVVKKLEGGGLVFRYIRYLVGTFKGKKAHIAAFHAYPKGGKNLPGILHMHGGGQRASLNETKYYASRGYSSISINWGGREMEEARPGDLNTDWGSVDPTQKNVPGYFNLLPGEHHLDARESPRNCNWFLLTLAGRRALTFLERQPEVDKNRLGIQGHSMGGNLTVYVAGSDDRVKAASPSVGGTGFRTYPYFHLPPQIRSVKGSVELFRATMGYQNYAPRIAAPILHLGATNDFHGLMDATYATGALIPHTDKRYVFAPHFNHRFNHEQAIARPLWFDAHLKGGFTLPETPKTQLDLNTADGVPSLSVRPDEASLPVTRIDVYYSEDPDPRARFFRSASTSKHPTDSNCRLARLPMLAPKNQPLFAFANIHYRLPQPDRLHRGQTVKEVCISSLLHVAKTEELVRAKVKATAKPTLLLDDFSQGFHDWFSLNPDNPHHWQHWTRKVTDSLHRGPADGFLSLRLRAERANVFVIVLKENAWRGYRGKEATYVHEAEVRGGDEPENLVLGLQDFRNVVDASPLKSWSELDQLAFCARYESRSRTPGSKPKTYAGQPWQGPPPKFLRLAWAKE